MYKASDYMVDDLTLQAVRAETAKALQKHGENTPRNGSMSREQKMCILMEPVGEIAKAICDFNLLLLSPEELNSTLNKELLKVAAMAALWVEAEDV